MIERWRPAGVTPLEVWDWPVDGRPAWKAMDDPVAVVRAIAGRLDPPRIWVCGGAAAALAPRTTTALVVAEDPRFAAHRAGHAWIGAHGVVADLGQTALKISDGRGRRVVVPRPAHLPPVTVESPPCVDPESSAVAGIRWVRDALAAFGPAERLVLALPCEVGDDCVPGSSTYEGWEGRRDLVHELTHGLYSDVSVVNDAELAGATARGEVGACLALTLGFAVGAALVRAP